MKMGDKARVTNEYYNNMIVTICQYDYCRQEWTVKKDDGKTLVFNSNELELI